MNQTWRDLLNTANIHTLGEVGALKRLCAIGREEAPDENDRYEFLNSLRGRISEILGTNDYEFSATELAEIETRLANGESIEKIALLFKESLLA